MLSVAAFSTWPLPVSGHFRASLILGMLSTSPLSERLSKMPFTSRFRCASVATGKPISPTMRCGSDLCPTTSRPPRARSMPLSIASSICRLKRIQPLSAYAPMAGFCVGVPRHRPARVSRYPDFGRATCQGSRRAANGSPRPRRGGHRATFRLCYLDDAEPASKPGGGPGGMAAHVPATTRSRRTWPVS